MWILASSSPRRKELLQSLVDDFMIIAPNVDEHIQVENPEYLPVEISKLKAHAVAKTHPNATILAADTIVIFQGQILGKPKDKEDAKRMLHLLSNQKHEVITGYTLIKGREEIHRQVITQVYFNALPDELIDAYVDTLSPLDKAGAYGIQDKDFPLVHHIEGSYSNVMGLPLEMLKKDL